MLAEQFEKRLIFFAGKGGVGRTTLSAAIGLAHARRKRRTLVVEMGSTPQMPALFGLEKRSSYEPFRLMKELPLYTCHLTPKAALAEYGVMKLKMRSIYKLVFENDFMRRLLEWVPGMDELLLIGKIWFIEQQRDRSGRPMYDRIIIDAPATGHGVSLLQLPAVIVDAVKSGPFATDSRPIRDLLQDPTRTLVHLVSLPEELPVRETLELSNRIQNDLNISLGCCFVNRVWPKPFTAREQRIVGQLRAAVRGRDQGIDTMMDQVINASRRRDKQQKHIQTLGDELTGLPIIQVPRLFTDQIGMEELDTLSHHMGKEQHA